MHSSFTRDILSYSIKLWAFLLAIVSPFMILLITEESYSFGLVTRFNLFMLFLIASLIVARLLSLRFKRLTQPKLEMRPSQWRTAVEVLDWFQRHEPVGGMLLMVGLIIVFVPLAVLWSWMISIGIIFSTTSAFIFLFVLILPFFIIPSSAISAVYESIIHPKKPSLFQITKVIEKFYEQKQCTGEMLESAKKTRITRPNRKTRRIALVLLALLVMESAILQLVELRFLAQQIVTWVSFLMTIQGIMALILFFVGDKRTALDLWIEPKEDEAFTIRAKIIRKLDVRKISHSTKRTVDKIEKSLWYKLAVILGGIITLLVSVLRLLRLI